MGTLPRGLSMLTSPSIGSYNVFPRPIVVEMMLSPYFNPFSKRTFVYSTLIFLE